jgi:hypothetical protein
MRALRLPRAAPRSWRPSFAGSCSYPNTRVRSGQASAALAVLIAPTLLAVQVWSWNRDAVGAARDVQSVDGIVSEMARQAAAGSDSVRDGEIARRFVEVFFAQPLSNTPVTWNFNEFSYGIRQLFTDSYRLTTFACSSFSCSGGRDCLRRAGGESRRKWLLVASSVLMTAIAYIAALH